MSIPNNSDQLRALFSQMTKIPDQEWLIIKDLFKLTHFKKGEIIEESGIISTHIGLIEKGLIRGYYTLLNGSEKAKNFRYEGNFFANYNSLLTKEPSLITIQALEDCTVWLAHFDSLHHKIKNSLFWQTFLRRANEREFLIKERREYELLTLNAKERYLSFLRSSPQIHERLSQYHIANYLGIDRSSFNRLIKSL
jgi:CRP-like cAMP-binding protein